MNKHIKPRPLTESELFEIEHEHKVLSERFQSYQEALVGMEVSSALAELEEFARVLRRHMRLEDEVLIPAYALITDRPRGGDPEYFRDEHRKIESQLGEILTTTRSLSTGSMSRTSILALLKRGMRFNDFIAHHIQREESILLPRLRDKLREDTASKGGA